MDSTKLIHISFFINAQRNVSVCLNLCHEFEKRDLDGTVAHNARFGHVKHAHAKGQQCQACAELVTLARKQLPLMPTMTVSADTLSTVICVLEPSGDSKSAPTT